VPCQATFTLSDLPSPRLAASSTLDVALPRLRVCVLARHDNACVRTGQTSPDTALAIALYDAVGDQVEKLALLGVETGSAKPPLGFGD